MWLSFVHVCVFEGSLRGCLWSQLASQSGYIHVDEGLEWSVGGGGGRVVFVQIWLMLFN